MAGPSDYIDVCGRRDLVNMSRELTIAFMGFAIASFYTPGPNNIMLLSSGLNFGFRRTLPHIAGITLGFAFLVLIVGLGMGAVFANYPLLQTVLNMPAR